MICANESVVLAHKALHPRLPVNLDKFREMFSAFEFIPVRGGAVMVRGNEVHVAVVPEAEGKWLSRSLIRDVLGSLIETYGEAVTAVMKDNIRGQRFVERLGFKQKKEENGAIFYGLESIRF